MKHGTLFADQSKYNKSKTELVDDDTETQDARNENQSQANRTFEKKNSVNEIEQSKPTTSGQPDISTSKSSHILFQRISYTKQTYGKLEKLTEPGQQKQIDFTGKLDKQSIHGDVQIIFAVYRFSKWPTIKICKTAETKEMIKSLTSSFNLNGIPEKIKSDKRGDFIAE